MSNITILTTEIFGNSLGHGYCADISRTDPQSHEYLLKYTPKYEYGRPFYKKQEHDYSRYTMLQLPRNEKHQFLSKSGRDGAYLGISMKLSNPILDAQAIKMLNVILDELRGTVYQELPNQNLQYLTEDIYGYGLNAYTQAIKKYVDSHNKQTILENPKQNIFEEISANSCSFDDYLLYVFPNTCELAKVLQELQSNGLNFTTCDNALIISNKAYQEYISNLYKNNSATIFEFNKSRAR